MADGGDYAAEVRSALEDCDTPPSRIDALLHAHAPTWLAWEVPTLLLDLDRGGAPVCPANQARIRGLYAMHLTGECFAVPESFEALAWLFGGVEAPGLAPNPSDLLRAVLEIRKVAKAHGELEPDYSPEVTARIADICRRAGYIVLPAEFPDVQAAIDVELTGEGRSIEKKARQIMQRSRDSGHSDGSVFTETPEGIAAARGTALELSLR